MINTSGVISTVAGNGTAGYSGDGGNADSAKLDSPYAVAVDLYGNLYITDFNNDVIRKVGTNDTISTYAGMAGVYGYFGDNGPATAAKLNFPAGIAVDNEGNLYIPDSHNDVIRKVNASGVITTVAGNGSAGFGGDLGNALGANLLTPFGVAVDKYGSIYIADAGNERIRQAYIAALSVSSVYTHNDVDVYPNPSAAQITLSGLSKADRVCVFDLTGRQMGAAWDVIADGSQTFNIRSLATGVYLLQVFDSNGSKKAVAQLVKE